MARQRALNPRVLLKLWRFWYGGVPRYRVGYVKVIRLEALEKGGLDLKVILIGMSLGSNLLRGL